MKKILPLFVVFAAAFTSIGCTRSARSGQESQPANAEVAAKRPLVSGTPTALKSDGFVTDQARVLDDGTRTELENVLRELQKRAKVDFAIAIIASTGGQDISELSLSMANDMKIGSENGGALLVIAANERRWHIQVNKRLERDLSNEEVRQIGEAMVPDLKREDFNSGLRRVVKKMIETLSEKQGFEPVTF